MKHLLKARFLLLLALAMQASVLFKGLHHHEEVCLLSDDVAQSGKEVLHTHNEEHEACAWDAFHLSACTQALPTIFSFLPADIRPVWVPVAPQKVSLFLHSPQGRAPPAV